MIDINLEMLVVALLAISIGSLLKGMTGLGLPLFSIPAMALFMPVEDAVVIMIIPAIGANLWLVISHRKYMHLLYMHRYFLILGFIGTLLGTWLLQNVSEQFLKMLLAIWLGLYLVQYFFKNLTPKNLKLPRFNMGGAIGFAAGALQGASGISAQIIAPYYHALGLDKAPYAFVVAFSFLLFSLGQLGASTSLELLTPERLGLGLLVLIPTLIFTRIGIWQAHRISLDVFNRILVAVFLIMEIRLLMDIL